MAQEPKLHRYVGRHQIGTDDVIKVRGQCFRVQCIKNFGRYTRFVGRSLDKDGDCETVVKSLFGRERAKFYPGW